MIALTDAAGDFDSYIVNVVSLQLTRDDGTVVQTVPVSTQVDFSQLVSLSEILSGTNDALQVVAEGPYDAGSVALSANAMAVLTND